MGGQLDTIPENLASFLEAVVKADPSEAELIEDSGPVARLGGSIFPFFMEYF